MLSAALTGGGFLPFDAGEKVRFTHMPVGRRTGARGAQGDMTGAAQASWHGCMQGDGRFVMRPAPVVGRATWVSGRDGISR